jgi:hypothetical protein
MHNGSGEWRRPLTYWDRMKSTNTTTGRRRALLIEVLMMMMMMMMMLVGFHAEIKTNDRERLI